jgi:hypothetical protein
MRNIRDQFDLLVVFEAPTVTQESSELTKAAVSHDHECSFTQFQQALNWHPWSTTVRVLTYARNPSQV